MINQSDSEFMPESDMTTDIDTDTDTNTDSTTSNISKPVISLLDTLTEDEIAEMTTQVYAELDEYITTNMLTFQSPTFYEKLKYSTIDTLFYIWATTDICEDCDEDYDEVKEFIEQTISVYLEICGVPTRSISYDNNEYIQINNPYTESSKNVDILKEKIGALQELNKKQPKQKTKEWHDFRNGLITASNLWKVFGSAAQQNSLIYEKCKQYDGNGGKLRSDSITDSFSDCCNTDSPLHWGVKYEPVTVMIYEEMFQTKVGEFGCFPHPQYSFIGASPDGINIDPTNSKFGRMLEIKNIKNREITQIPKEEYWVQTQIQMETCDLDECDFIETRFIEYETEPDFYKDMDREYKGVILYFIERNPTSPNSNNPNYIYMPLDIGRDKEAIDDWIISEKKKCKIDGLALFSVLYWYLDEFSCILIPRNKPWFNVALPKIEEIWQTIEKERKEGYEHRNTKKHKTQVTNDVSGYMIHNLNLTNSICLVKLDN